MLLRVCRIGCFAASKLQAIKILKKKPIVDAVQWASPQDATPIICERAEFPEVEKQINDLGMEIDLNESPEEFIHFLKSEAERLSVAVDKYGLRNDL